MSRRNYLNTYPIITSGSMTSTSTVTSKVSNIQYLDNIGIQFDWTGSPTGTFQVQISANYAQDTQGNVTNAGTWIPLTLTYWNGTANVTGTTVPTSVGSPVYLDLDFVSAPWIRAVYTNVSGSGTLTAVIVAKAVA
jgi:hypothetical protein